MTNPYGPWATAIDAGRNPQLSAFWRQRLTMLVAASKTSPVLSRHNLLGLVAAAVLVCALPTFHAVPAVAEQEKVAQEQSDGARMDAGGKEPATAVSRESGGKAKGGDVSPKEVLAAWRKRQASIESFQYRCQLKDKKTQPKRELARTFIFSLCGDRIAWSEFGEQWGPERVSNPFAPLKGNGPTQTMKERVAYDGIYTRKLDDFPATTGRRGVLALSNGPRQYRDLVTAYDTQTQIWLWFSPVVWLHGQGYYPEKMSVANLHAPRDGQDCVELSMISSINPLWKVLIYVDPARDYVPLQIVQILDGDVMQERAIRYVRDAKVGWRVSGWNSKSDRYKQDISCEVVACSVNAAIADDVFTFEFPQRTLVKEPFGETENGAWKYFIALGGGKRRYISKDEYDKHFEIDAAGKAKAVP